MAKLETSIENATSINNGSHVEHLMKKAFKHGDNHWKKFIYEIMRSTLRVISDSDETVQATEAKNVSSYVTEQISNMGL